MPEFPLSTVCRSPDVLLFFFTTHMTYHYLCIIPIIEYASCLWDTGYVDDLRKLERAQRRWTKQVEGPGDLSYPERLKQLELFSVKGRLCRADLIPYWKIFDGKSCNVPDFFFYAIS